MQEHPPLLFALPPWFVLDDRLIISVSQGEIEVILPGTDFRAVYYKSTGETHLFAKSPPNGTHEFRARAWWEACQMARQLGWLVWLRSPLKLWRFTQCEGLGNGTAPAEADATQLGVCTLPQGINGLLHGDCGLATLSIVLVQRCAEGREPVVGTLLLRRASH